MPKGARVLLSREGGAVHQALPVGRWLGAIRLLLKHIVPAKDGESKEISELGKIIVCKLKDALPASSCHSVSKLLGANLFRSCMRLCPMVVTTDR